MSRTKQHIFRERRKYNQWVNNQTLEDYALRFTAKSARRWSISRVANTALGAISFLALEAIGASITLSYGFDNAFIAILVVGMIIFLTGIPICYYAAKYGVDLDLLTRGASFGYIGSTITSLIYATFTFIFFALEAAIMATALKLLFGIPLSIGYILCSIIVIPMVTHGITFISRFQLWTQPVWAILQILPFVFIIYSDVSSISDWQQFEGLHNKHPGTISLVYFGASTAILFALVTQIGEQVDYLRFFPEKNSSNKIRWWLGLLSAGPGWVIVGVIKIFAGSFLVYLCLQSGIPESEAADPTRMYMLAFSYITQSPDIALAIAGLFVIISQLKINVTNSYAGSIAWSNFFSRLTHSHPGRVVWLVFNVVIALLLMELGIYQTFESTLGAYAVIAVAWFGSLVADLVINKPLKLSPAGIEFKRAHLHNINPVGVGSMLSASVIGISCYIGLWGEDIKALSHFITIGSTLLISPLIAWATGGCFYIAREPTKFKKNVKEVNCSVCQNTYEIEDVAYCPAYTGSICSLCCSLDSRCHDLCKTSKKSSNYIGEFFNRFLPISVVKPLSRGFVQFLLLLFSISCIVGALLWLISVNATSDNLETNLLINNTLWNVFFILIIITGVISWLFVLAQKSSLVAQEESRRQNKLLVNEITAHDKTAKALQSAKEHAEAASNAKSRYLTGISHEVRTPLNSILGYAQLLENDKQLPETTQAQVLVMRRSGEHLADLIEGMLDISSIEAGKLFLHRDQVKLNSVIEQLVYMFRSQAEDKGLTFNYECHSILPKFVTTDEKRLRQILINLLSNAIKFTQSGQITFSVRYKNQVARFEIIDSGIGIPEADLERIFLPFERIRRSGVPPTKGTGLGLTITRLLTEILGGELSIKNNDNVPGVTANALLMLSEITTPDDAIFKQRIFGYKGDRKTVTIVDDDATHRGLISDILSPLGFIVLEAHDGETCLAMHKEHEPDIYLLDFSMPGLDGWQVAECLRNQKFKKPIIMLSANVGENNKSHLHPNAINNYIVKPIKLDNLLEKLGTALAIEWLHEPNKKPDDRPSFEQTNSQWLLIPKTGLPDRESVIELIELAQVGHLSALKNKLQELKSVESISQEFHNMAAYLVSEVRFDSLIKNLNESLNNE